jgi:hypothetical protein
MNKIRDISFISSIFLSLSSIHLGFVDIYYYYLFIAFLFPLLLYKYKTIDRGFLIIMSYLIFSGIVNVLFINNDFPSLIKIFTGVLIAYWFFYLLIKDYDFDLKYLFEKYYKYAAIVAAIGLFQFFSFLINFEYGYDFTWLGLRKISEGEIGGAKLYPIHSILGEPAAYAVVMAPAMFIALNTLFRNKNNYKIGNKFQAIIIVITYILTQSSTGYVSLLVSVLILNSRFINFKKIAIISSLIPITIFVLYNVSVKFKDRLSSSISLITGNIVYDSIESSSKAEGSSLILFNHLMIAIDNAYDHPLGTGLGSHHVAFHRYNTLRMYFTGYGSDIILNLHDGSSLFTRILSEMGYVGVFFTLLFLISFFTKKGDDSLILINHASLIIIFACLLRGGHYFIMGLPFFIFCYYYSSQFNKVYTNHNSVH